MLISETLSSYSHVGFARVFDFYVLWHSPDVIDFIEEFVEQLSEVASTKLALLKWDGTSDLTTEYQIIRMLSGYQIERSLVKFNLVIGDGSLIHLEELHDKKTIQL
ncbi:hypothetical protein [Phormidesmis priestleyi]